MFQTHDIETFQKYVTRKCDNGLFAKTYKSVWISMWSYVSVNVSTNHPVRITCHIFLPRWFIVWIEYEQKLFFKFIFYFCDEHEHAFVCVDSAHIIVCIIVELNMNTKKICQNVSNTSYCYFLRIPILCWKWTNAITRRNIANVLHDYFINIDITLKISPTCYIFFIIHFNVELNVNKQIYVSHYYFCQW